MLNQFSRTQLLLGSDNMERLANAKVAVIGIGGVGTFKNAKKLKDVAAAIPIEKIVLETDCPYMAPEPNRGKRNDSSQLIYVAQKLAEIKGITAEEVKQATTENAHRLYRLTQNK